MRGGAAEAGSHLKLMARLEKENVYVTAIYGRYSRVLIQLKGDGYDIVDVNRLL